MNPHIFIGNPSQAFSRSNRHTANDQSYILDEEVEFPDGKLITSRTDLNGIITHANEAFVTMSAWSREELIGQPHSILRHPDMPKAAFADLWHTVSKGEKWHGYVKNLRKDGRYYWVYATVIPNIRNGKIEGYTSVRRRASAAMVAEISDIISSFVQRKENSYVAIYHRSRLSAFAFRYLVSARRLRPP